MLLKGSEKSKQVDQRNVGDRNLEAESLRWVIMSISASRYDCNRPTSNRPVPPETISIEIQESADTSNV